MSGQGRSKDLSRKVCALTDGMSDSQSHLRPSVHLPCLGVFLGMRTIDVCRHPVLESVHLFSVPSPQSQSWSVLEKNSGVVHASRVLPLLVPWPLLINSDASSLPSEPRDRHY